MWPDWGDVFQIVHGKKPFAEGVQEDVQVQQCDAGDVYFLNVQYLVFESVLALHFDHCGEQMKEDCEQDVQVVQVHCVEKVLEEAEQPLHCEL